MSVMSPLQMARRNPNQARIALRPTALSRGIWPVSAMIAACVLAQWPLLTNPGYFSHDELQWASFAGDAGPIQWFSWTAIDTFQFRPLTYNIWLWLSREFFAEPRVFHSVLVVWGAVNCAALYLLGRRFGVRPAPAAAGILVFALSPYATFVHGWIGTIGDLLWVSAGLALGLATARVAARRDDDGAGSGSVEGLYCLILVGVLSAALTGLGLLAKEAAVAIPALLSLAWWFDGRKRSWVVATAVSGAVVAIYLVLRIDALLNTPNVGAYTLSAAHAPKRWLELQLFGFMPDVFETFNSLAGGVTWRVLIAGALWLALLAALWQSGWRAFAIFVLGGIAALAPVLPLAESSNQYGYGFAAVVTMVAAAAWSSTSRWGKGVLLVAALTFVWHGVYVMHTMRRVGEVQAVFSPALVDALEMRGDEPLRLHVAVEGDRWIFERLTHDIPSYRGVPVGSRVRLVGKDWPADGIIAADGSLTEF